MLSQDRERKFEEIIEKHRDQVYRMCWGFANNAFDVDDLFQEVMINIWRGFQGFKGKSSMSTWIYRITVNTCMLWRKREGKNKNQVDNYPDDTISQGENREEKNEQVLALRNAIQQLKKIDRTLILLLLEGCSYQEISEVTGLSTSNVGAKISRIKTKIKKLIQNK